MTTIPNETKQSTQSSFYESSPVTSTQPPVLPIQGMESGAEYKALRDEIVKRLELQYQFMYMALIILGTTLGLGLQARASSLVLVYPLIAPFLAAAWAYNDYIVRLLGKYIKVRIESGVGKSNMGWEHFFQEWQSRSGAREFASRECSSSEVCHSYGPHGSPFHPISSLLHTATQMYLSGIGIFIVAPLLAILLAVPIARWDATDIPLFVLAAIGLIFSIFRLRPLSVEVPDISIWKG